jgi:choline dehydrogenase-like flavoprotein
MRITDKRPIVEKEAYDLVVVGGGVAGVSTAVSASRHGLRVLILEKTMSLGGLATIGLISYYEPLCNGQGKQLVFGIGEELIKLAIKDGYDNLSKGWKTGEGEKWSYATFYSPTAFTMALDEYVLQNGVTVRFDSHAVAPVMENNVCIGVLVESKAGREFYPAKAVVDATGDAEICDKAGIPTVVGTNYMLGMAHYTNRQLALDYANGGSTYKFRKWLYAVDDTNKNINKIHKGVTPEDITEFVITGRKAVLNKIREEDKDFREVLALPQMPQYRTIRHIVGAEVFRAELGKVYQDAIGTCGNWRKAGLQYQIPYGCTYHDDFPNIWAVGRIVSTDEEMGWEVTRVIPTCTLTGQAVGVAVALSLQNGVSAKNVDIKTLQETLTKDGVVIQ